MSGIDAIRVALRLPARVDWEPRPWRSEFQCWGNKYSVQQEIFRNTLLDVLGERVIARLADTHWRDYARYNLDTEKMLRERLGTHYEVFLEFIGRMQLSIFELVNRLDFIKVFSI